MLEARQDLPFALEAPHNLLGGGPAADQLEGDALVELPVGALGEEDGAHPAPPERLHDAIRPHALALGRQHAVGQQICGEGDGVDREAVEQRMRVGIGGEQGADLGKQIGVVRAGCLQEGVTLGGVAVQRRVEETLDLRPAGHIHGGEEEGSGGQADEAAEAWLAPLPMNAEKRARTDHSGASCCASVSDGGFISRLSQARARRQSRRTVDTETSSTSAISFCVSPPKKRYVTTLACRSFSC